MHTNILVAVLIIGASVGQVSAQARVFTKLDHKEAPYDLGGAFYPTWTSQGLFGAEFELTPSDAPVLWRIGKDGNRENIVFSFAGGRRITILGVACAMDGRLAVIGFSYDADGRPVHFLSFIAKDHITKTITRLSPYVPSALTVAPDGVVWTAGWVQGSEGDVKQPNVLKRFDPSGKLLSTSPLQVRGIAGQSRGDVTAWSILRTSKDRVAWLTVANQYLEFGLDGSELSRLNGPPGRMDRDMTSASFVLSAANDALVSFTTEAADGSSTVKIWSLDRAKNAWSSIGGEKPPSQLHLFGFDGDAVIASGTIPSRDAGMSPTIVRYSVSGRP
jgi:hypothetical protein